MAESAIRRWTTTRTSDSPTLAPLINTIYFLPIPLRKVLLTACRIQLSRLSDKSSRLYQRYRVEWTTNIPFPNDKLERSSTLISLRSFAEKYIAFFSDPTLAGFVSMLLRFLPYSSYESMREVRDATLKKELQAATSIYHPVSFTYQNLFGAPIHRNTTLAGGAGGNAALNVTIRTSIQSAARSLTRPLYPRTSTRTVMTGPYKACYEPYSSCLRRPREITTTRDIEEVYFRTGWKLDGVTEMRSAWKGNDLKPRVYYARGAVQHFASSIIQEIFSALVDALPMTHRRNRFNLYDMEMLRPDMTLMIYDYSSFTSTLHEIRNFTSRLADFLHGTTVTVVDSFLGPQEKDLGDILHAYNQECNMTAEFDVSQLLSITDAVMEHNCGMLGVPGNITSCTLLHGIHLALVLGALYRGKVIGDDAIGMYVDDKDMERVEMVDELQAIGRLELSKVEFWRDEDDDENSRWNYEKRPFGRVHERPYKGELINWPSINISMGIVNPFHRPLFYTPQVEFKIACRQWARFQMHIPPGISEHAQEVVVHLYRRFWEYWEIPRERRDRGYIGWMPVKGTDVEEYVILPPCGKNFFLVRSREFLMDHFGSLVIMPIQPTLQADGYGIGVQFHAHMTPLLSHLKAMDVIDGKKLSEFRLIEDCSWDSLEDMMQGRLKFAYEFSILDHPPDWSKQELRQYFAHLM